MSQLKKSTIEKLIRKHSKLTKIKNNQPIHSHFTVIENPSSTTEYLSISFSGHPDIEKYLQGMCAELSKFEYIQLGSEIFLYKNANINAPNNGICFTIDYDGFWRDYREEVNKLWPGQSTFNWISNNIDPKYIAIGFALHFAMQPIYSFFNNSK